jgi:large subunit ribosomal protein L10
MGEYITKASPLKKKALQTLEQRMEGSSSIIFTDYRGLSVAEMNKLRSEFFKAGTCEFLVVKNSILRMALENRGVAITDESMLQGPIGIGMSDEPVSPAKTLSDFAKIHKNLEFKGALVDGEFYGADKVHDFANMPSQEQLYASIVGSVASPLGGFVNLLNEIVRQFVAILDAVIQEKQKEEGAAA